MMALFILLLCCLGPIINAEEEEFEKVKIKVTFMPKKCEVKTKASDMVKIKFTGALQNGTVITPRDDLTNEFQLGGFAGIAGIHHGLKEMCRGEKRKVTIPPRLGYGGMDSDQIPANSYLVFDIELVSFRDGPELDNPFKNMDYDEDNHVTFEELRKYMINQYQSDDPQTHSYVKTIFDETDTNKDGFLSIREFHGPDHDEL